MSHPTEVPVLVVGAGPVGLTAALDLAWRGIAVVVVELRYRGQPPVVKCNHISSRSMEAMRRLGLAESLRNAGLPADFPNDVAFLTSATGTEFARIPIPSVAQRRQGVTEGFVDADWPTPEPPHRINQLFLEPILFERAASHPLIRICNRTQLESLEQHADYVVAQVRDLDTGLTEALVARYVVGCDGARSVVRKSIGAVFEGNPQIARNLSTHIRAPGLLERMQQSRPLSWMSHAINPQRSGNVIAIDGKDMWLVHCRMKDDEADFDAVDRDLAIRTVLGVGPDFAYEVLGKEDWVARRLVASHMRRGRVFIAGDAAHIWIPVAGYGMNCGIADVLNLTWKLAAVEQGWAPPTLLDAYELERHPITEQVSHFVADLGMSLTPKRNKPPAGIDAPGPEGDAVRAAFGADMLAMNVAQYCCAGLNFGYFYDQSPVIAYDGEAAPGYTMGTFTESTVPGCRLPHIWLAEGVSLYDQLGPVYTVVCWGHAAAAEGERLAQAAEGVNLPLTVLALPGPRPPVYRHDLILVRPDQHIAWRGDTLPDDAEALLDRVRGGAMSMA